MPLFRGSAGQLHAQIEGETLIPTLQEQYRFPLGRSAPHAEVRSWERSLQALSADLMDAGLENGARLAAGYCWTWSDPIRDGGLVGDIHIGDWQRPWNNKKPSSHGGAPGTPFWATDAAGFEQVGCVYTAQGFEYDYSGDILGPDLVWRQRHWIAQPGESHDSQVKRGSAEDFARSIRNTYKVLLTRGMRGAIVYSADPETQALLESLVPTHVDAPR